MAEKKLQPGVNDLETWCKQNGREDLLREWDYNKNEVMPSQVSRGTEQRVWWVCPEGHSYETDVGVRSAGKGGCPYCLNKKVLVGYNDLLTTHPDIAKDWNYEKNEGLTPQSVVGGTPQKVWWKCADCGNEWVASVAKRTGGRGCPECGKLKSAKSRSHNRSLNGNDFETWCKENERCDLLNEWDYDKNDIQPNQISKASEKVVSWVCPKGHKYDSPISTRRMMGPGCPVCYGRRVLVGYNDLGTTSPEIAAYWDYERNGCVTPQDVTKGSNKKVWWKCDAGHHYEQIINSKTKQNLGCPYCSGRYAICGETDLATTMPDIANQWDFEKNGDMTPQDVPAGSNKIVWWKCPKGHSYSAMINSRTGCGTGCPTCASLRSASTPEKLACHYLNLAFGDKYQIIPNDRNALENGTELDIYIPELKIGVEYDGAYYHDKNEQRKELRKNKQCKEKGIDLIRIRQKGLSNMEDCYCILRDNESMSDMDECISAMLDYILTTTGIDIPYDIYSIGGEDDFINCKRDKQVAIDLRDSM